ncbi:MAG: excinuclease ABC subunit UvrA [Deltaproteobacteria bacterium]|nr:excinuclease ABC subunit UvrA [Deltaproteobacteria bacterium]
MAFDYLEIRGAREHNLKNLHLRLPRDRLVVITGVSGSGKSSLAFDTLYAEGQRRYVESLSTYARQFLEQMTKPDVDAIEGLSPAIAIEQKTTSKNPRSTVGTVTEIYDYLRLLYARVGQPACPSCGKPVSSQTPQQIVDRLLARGEGVKALLMAPIVRGRKGEYKKELADLQRDGFTRVRVDGETHELGAAIKIDKRKNHDIDVIVDRIQVKESARQRISDSVELALRTGEGLVRIGYPDAGEEELLSERLSCIDCGLSLPEIEPRTFSFNSPHGACPECSGLGEIARFDPERVVPDPSKSLRDGAVAPWASKSVWYGPVLDAVAKHYQVSMTTPWRDLPKSFREIVLFGSGEQEIRVVFKGEDSHYKYTKPFEGVIPSMERRLRETEAESVREGLAEYQRLRPCGACSGARLRKEARVVRVGALAIHELTHLTVQEALGFFDALELSARDREIAARILKEIRERLGFLVSVGLDYLTLDRAAASLSGGEGQRIRLATQIGSSLVGVLYILDEPSIGLHQRDNTRLLETLKRLRDLGNTVIVVEHDEETISSADWVVDMGPGAGRHGGFVVSQGTPQEIRSDPRSLTGQYLAGTKRIEVPRSRRTPAKDAIWVSGARGHNLRDLDVRFPLGVLTCVTGVSGSGKSTLVNDTLYAALARDINGAQVEAAEHRAIEGIKALDKVIDIDQSPIGRTPRSNPATYTGLFGDIRDLFASLPEAKMRGFGPGRFSFNVKGGRCEACEGDGIIRIEMHFLPDIFVTCEQCGGKRYNRETLEILYKGKSIAEVLEMTVAEAVEFLGPIPSAMRKLQTLYDVGLGYIHLGQQATTLSGGEAQRVKLAKELSRRATGRTLYVLDEPTTGLHFDDVAKLLEVLHRLVEQGNTVIVIEHNLDVIKTADWVLDLGPEGGGGGGRVIAEGTPEHVAQIEESHTGRYLARVLRGDRISEIVVDRRARRAAPRRSGFASTAS